MRPDRKSQLNVGSQSVSFAGTRTVRRCSMKIPSSLLLATVVLTPLSAVADDTLVTFDGAIGAIGVSSGLGTDATATTVTRNIVRRRRHHRNCDRHVRLRWSGSHQCFRHTHLRKYRPIYRTQYEPEGRSSRGERRLQDRRRAVPAAAGAVLLRYTRAADPQCGQPELLRRRDPEVRH